MDTPLLVVSHDDMGNTYHSLADLVAVKHTHFFSPEALFFSSISPLCILCVLSVVVLVVFLFLFVDLDHLTSRRVDTPLLVVSHDDIGNTYHSLADLVAVTRQNIIFSAACFFFFSLLYCFFPAVVVLVALLFFLIDLIRMSISDKCSGSMEVTTHLVHISQL